MIRSFLLGLFLTFASQALAQKPADLRPTAFAIKDAKVVVSPGQTLPKATIIIRDGFITAVGPDEKIPADAVVMEAKKDQMFTVYAGFLDLGSSRGFDAALRRSEGGPAAIDDIAADALIATKPDNRKGLTPEFGVYSALKFDEEAITPWRRLGFTGHLISPSGGYLSGTSALVSMSGEVPRDATLKSQVAMHAAFGRVPGVEYPTALMGIVAHTRQVFIDAGWLKRKWETFEKNGKVGKRPYSDPCLEALWPVLDGKLPIAFEADTADQIHRVLDVCAEFKLKPIIVGGKSAWKVADRLKGENVPVLLKIDYSTATEREAELPVRVREERERLRKEEYANAGKLHSAGIKFGLTSTGTTATTFRGNLRKAIQAGLPADVALAALTTDAAMIMGVESQVGKIEKGKAAHLVICDGDFSETKTKFLYAFADGIRFDLDEKNAAPTGAGADGPGAGGPGTGRGRRGNPMNEPSPSTPMTPAATPSTTQPLTGLAGGRGGPGGSGDRSNTPAFNGNAFRALIPMLDAIDLTNTEIESDRKPKIQTKGNVLVRNVTIITGTGKTLTNSDILVTNGKIAAMGPKLTASIGVTVIDGTGLFAIAGIIDTHSHFAISGGVNDASLSVVPEIRVRDVIDSEDVQIYRALGGGVTTARLLHGSANCIGGQDAVIKMKYGRPAKEMLISEAPRGVKFALGENVKRSDGRFPNSRLGVEAVMIRSFTEAKEYRKTWDDYEKSKQGGSPLPEPRRDLRLEALSDIIAGDLRIHSHCYRADEILMLLRVADMFGVKVRSLQHVLEGYKVAPEIAHHGSSVSIFSDWWAYKIEAFDAIPYGAKLLLDAGVMVCLKSDDNELMRHLNQEAAKLIKYCDFSAEEALHTITLNPAKQLGLEKRMGTLEVGKDADIALFSGHPLNAYARCEMTFVEGELYFQRSETVSPNVIANELIIPKAAPFAGLENEPAASAYVLKGGTIHQPGQKPYLGTIIVTGTQITSVTPAGQEKIPAGAKVVDVTGKHLFPGLIDAGTVLGLVEIDSARETNDSRDGGDLQPDLKASIGVNPDSELIPVTRANGVTTVVTRPTGSLMPGQGSLINMAGWTPKNMTIADSIFLHIEYPSDPMPRGFGMGLPDLDRDSSAARFRKEEKLTKVKELFESARRYEAAKKANLSIVTNPRLEALLPYARGEKPVAFTADKKGEILGAIKLAEEIKVKPIISSGTESWKVANTLAEKKVPVILGPIMGIARETGDQYDANYTAANRLYRAGVQFSIRSAGSNNTRNLPYEVAQAIAYGLPPEEGLKAVTQNAATILGVGDKLGSLDAGKLANLVVTDGDIMQPSTKVLQVFINGKPLDPTSKQTRLYDKYRKRLNEVQSGPTPTSGTP